jgi:hypothetical protein
LREVEDAGHQRDQAGNIQRNDAAGEAGEAQRQEELTGAVQPAERTLPARELRGFDGNIVEYEGRRGALGVQAWIRLCSIKQWPKLPGCFYGASGRRWLCILPELSGGVS